MMTSHLYMIGAGFTLGLLHAFDADHVMAVSAMSNDKPNKWRTLRFCANWALGHSGVLIISGLFLFGLGLSLPQNIQHLAEASVGVLLIVLGISCFVTFYRQRVRLVSHSHGEVEHVHWQVADRKHAVNGQHKPVMVGMLHGLAGSAPALALVPVVSQGQLWWALTYLMVFSVGVMLSMLIFGFGLGSAQRYMAQTSARVFDWVRYAIASISILLGGYWLSQAL